MTPHANGRRRAASAFACLIFLAAPSAEPAEALPSERAVVNPLGVGAPYRLEDFLGRPLFSSSRRPPPPHDDPAALPTGQAEPPPDFRLLGIVQMSNESVAQIAEGMESRRYSVRVGDYLGDWLVTEIEKSSLTLLKGEHELKLALFVNRDGKDKKDQDASATRAVDGNWGAGDTTPPIAGQSWTNDDLKNFFGDSP